MCSSPNRSLSRDKLSPERRITSYNKQNEIRENINR